MRFKIDENLPIEIAELLIHSGHDFSHGIRGRFYRPKKISTSMRIDNDILLYLKKMASEKKQDIRH